MTAFTSCNPSSGEVCFTRPSWNPSALEVSLRQLRDAQGAWADLNVEQRAKRLLRLADLLSQQREALADLVTLEVGKRTSECLAEIDKSAQLIRYYAELAPELLQPLRIATQASRSGVAFEPLGLVLAVMPWNYPVWQVLRFAIPALMSGNACLVKPAPSVPQCSQLLLDIVRQAGLRVLDIAWIETELVEEAIRQCDAVAFTGSTQTGRAIASLAGRHLKKTVLELGGSNPFIVLADADIEAAARDAANSRFRDAGQSCNAAKRMIVVPEIADAFVEAFCGEASKLRAGDPRDPATTLSPLTRADLREALHAQVLDACHHGAELRLGGQMPHTPGFYYPATVLDRVNPDCRVYHEEVFGPVASILRATDEADAIRLANDTPFGLGASIYSADNERAWQLARRIEAGSVFINRHTSSDLRLPFGGVKASGYGRELSEFGLYEFVNVKTYWQK
ncbi:Acyl-CoA reductase [Chromobacterium violaceum]|uniref:Aldehyde dehydrogenase n=1 Tax=Chromobacterium violaceum TaxID=536 RepID=A0A202B4T8_CHRVL|nr:NAD-dependent succinate-semialdehyde dehydrogenase [Chromobacterium violaceum]KJH66593.1 aldehyde dehydrogenase [Chromobacterium violaceum]KMN48058.1 aldehyde dehydrogenase [Chromobacterium violaceum]KMN86450.1 aldehyde dehydrogenase [Chromobacterium violaceum]KMN89932.1 aldehyde dehydrogenase [Chromobacterium violaceum]KMO02154.1 aldehyde dehydrogenase [Chromobacterium violaceum]